MVEAAPAELDYVDLSLADEGEEGLQICLEDMKNAMDIKGGLPFVYDEEYEIIDSAKELGLDEPFVIRDVEDESKVTLEGLFRNDGFSFDDMCSSVDEDEEVESFPSSSHSDDTSLVCNICGYKCAIKSYLKLHMRSHSTCLRYTCEICNFACSFKFNLKLHMITHTVRKPYACKFCDSKFVLNQHLKRHVMTSHSNEKPYKCSNCDFGTARKEHLRNHVKVHMLERYSCKLCDHKCSNRRSLAKHARIHTHIRE